MNNHFKIILIVFSLIIISCPGTSYIRPPDNFALEFIIENNMNTSVDVSIRDYHSWQNGFSIARTEWRKETIENNQSRLIGGTDENENYNLITPEIVSFASGVSIISFEIKLTTVNETIYLAGYETDDPKYNDSGLLFIKIPMEGENLAMYSKEQTVIFKIDYIISIKLIVNEDGTYTFTEEMVKDSAGITILKPV